MPRKKKTEEEVIEKTVETVAEEKTAAKKTTKKTAAKRTTKKAAKKPEPDTEENTEKVLEVTEEEKEERELDALIDGVTETETEHVEEQPATAEPVVLEEKPEQLPQEMPQEASKDKPNNGESHRIWSVDGTLKADTENSIMDNIVRDINDSIYSKRVLTGNLLGIEYVTNKNNGVSVPLPYIMYNKVKIVFTPQTFGIPKFVQNLNLAPTDRKYNKALLLWYQGFVGAPIRFVVKQWLDKASDLKVLLADRVEAMKLTQSQFLFREDNSGYYTVNAGDRVEVDVLSVREKSMYVDFRGYEARIGIADILYNPVKTDDLRQRFAPGDRVVVKVKGIERDTVHRVVTKAALSVKEEREDPFVIWTRILKQGDSVVGTVSHIDQTGYYCSVHTDENDKIVVLGNLSGANAKRPVIGSTVLLRINRVERKDRKIYGRIVNVIRQ